MTTGQFSEVDLDRLADFVGGALDGTPDEAEVRRLIRDDPAWSEAYAELGRALAEVRDQLAVWGARPEELPPSVAERLDAALVSARCAAVDQTDSPNRPPGRRDGTSSGPGPRGPGRRRWSRATRPILTAALIAAILGGGVGLLRELAGPGAMFDEAGGDNDAATTTAAESDGSVQLPRMPSAVRPLASGTDYDTATLPRATTLADRVLTSTPGVPRPGLGPDADLEPGTPPTELARLADPVALNDCVAAVSADHGMGAVTVHLVDLASYQGKPAVVLVFADGIGARWVWVAGPGCGLPSVGADTRDSTRVG